MTKWNLPPGLSNAVFLHHNPSLDTNREISEYQPNEIPIEFILQFGNHLAKHTGHGFNDFKVLDLDELPLSRVLNYSQEEYLIVADELEAEFEAELKLFEG